MKESIESMKYRYNKLLQNGKNREGYGIMRKLYYKIVNAQEELVSDTKSISNETPSIAEKLN